MHTTQKPNVKRPRETKRPSNRTAKFIAQDVSDALAERFAAEYDARREVAKFEDSRLAVYL